MSNTEKCQHSRTDLSWSYGELRRCIDCGAIEDPYGSGNWIDIAKRAIANAADGNMRAVLHFKNLLDLGRRDGIPYPDMSLDDILAAGALLAETTDKHGRSYSRGYGWGV